MRFRILNISIILLMGCTLLPLKGQTGTMIPDLVSLDSARAASLLKRAEKQVEKDSLDQASILASESLQLSMRSNLKETEVSALILIADIYSRLDQSGDAIPYYLRVAEIFETNRDFVSLTGIYEKEGDYGI